MRLIELCEPVFLHVCCLNRATRHDAGKQQSFASVREELWDVLRKAQARATDQGLLEEYKKIRLPLVYFVDEMIGRSEFPFAERWKKEGLARVDAQHPAGTHFFELLEEILADPSPDVDDQIEVYFTCLGLGFEGIYKDNPAALREVSGRVHERIRDRMEVGDSPKICPEAYEYTDRRKLHRSVLGQVGMIAVGCVFLLGIAFAFNGVLYLDKTKLLRDNLSSAPQAPPALETDPASGTK